MVDKLLVAVRDRARVPIVSKRDCEILSALVLETTDEFISYNTLRRLYGLAPGGTPRRQTLDVLSRYCGFAHYEGFCASESGVAHWSIAERTFIELQQNDMAAVLRQIRSLPDQNDRMSLIVQVSRELLLTGRYTDFISLFQSRALRLSRWEYSHQLHFGISVGMLLPSIPLDDTPLWTDPSFIDTVYLTHVDYRHLNGHYGRWTEAILRNPPSPEVKAFAQCIRGFRNHLQGRPIGDLPRLGPDLQAFHPILRSRIMSIHWLAGEKDIHKLWIAVHGLVVPETLPLTWVHELSVVSLLEPSQALMEWLDKLSLNTERLAHFELHHRQLLLLNAFALATLQRRNADALRLESQICLEDITLGYRDLIEWGVLRMQVRLHPKSKAMADRLAHLTAMLGLEVRL